MAHESELHLAQQAAVAAGQIIANYYGQTLRITVKSGDQPVTQADLEANQCIRTMIMQEFPDDAWLSEEDADDTRRFETDRVWIIDPLDGTRDFINKNPEFAVSIALAERGTPVVAVVYNPMTKEMFHATQNGGAFVDGHPIWTRTDSNLAKLKLLVSQSEFKRGDWQNWNNTFEISPTGGCAYKMARIARGDADGTFTLKPKSEWDICAGHLLITEARGCVTHLDGDPIVFNQPSTLLEGLVYSSCKRVHDHLLTMIRTGQF